MKTLNWIWFVAIVPAIAVFGMFIYFGIKDWWKNR